MKCDAISLGLKTVEQWEDDAHTMGLKSRRKMETEIVPEATNAWGGRMRVADMHGTVCVRVCW